MDSIKEENEKNWGGARKGAGRKKKAEYGKYYSFRAKKSVEETLEAVEGSKSEYINNAIAFYAENFKPE